MASVQGQVLDLDEAASSRAGLRRAILLLAWPVAAEMTLHTITQMADMAMLGRLGPESVAAVGLSFRPLFVGMSVFLGMGAGTTAMVARFVGARDYPTAVRATHQAVLSAFSVAFLLALITAIFSRPIIAFMGAEPDVLPLGATYVRLMSPGLLFSFTGMVAASALRGAGDTRTSLRVNAGVNALNIVLNYILIFGHLGFPALGVMGAGIATSIARGLGGTLLLFLMFRGRLVLNLPRQNFFRVDTQMVARILRVGLPAMVERVLFSTAMVLHLKMLATLGTQTVAAATLAQSIEEISILPSIGLSVASGALVGQMLGASRPQTAEQAGWESVRIGLLFMGSMGVLFILFPALFLAIYGAEGQLLLLGQDLLRVVGAFQVPMSISLILGGAIRGAGDTRFVMHVTLFSSWFIRLGLTAIVLFWLGQGAVIAYAMLAVDWLVRTFLLVRRFRGGRWKETEV